MTSFLLAPLVWSGKLITSYTLPKLILISFGIMAFKKGAYRSREFDLPILLFLLVAIASTACSQDVLLSVCGAYNYYAYGLVCMFMLYCVYWIAGGVYNCKVIINQIIIVGCLASLAAIFQKMGYQVTVASQLLAGRAVGTVGSPVSLGVLLAMIFPLAFSRSGLWKYTTPLILAGMLCSFSRGAIAGGFIGCLVFLAYDCQKYKYILLTIAILATAALFAATVVFDPGRVEIWKIAIKTFPEHPYLGSGIDSFIYEFRQFRTPEYIKAAGNSVEYQVHAHNIFLQVLATSGLFGIGALILLIKQFFSKEREYIYALVPLFICLQFNPVPMEALVIGAILLAFSASGKSVKIERSYPIRLVGLCALIFWSLMSYPDYQLMKGKTTSNAQERYVAFNKATKGMGKCEMHYLISNVNFLNMAGMPEEAMKISRQAVNCHPRDSMAHNALGTSALVASQKGSSFMQMADDELDIALRLYPSYSPLIYKRMKVAEYLGKTELTERLKIRYSIIEGLNGNKS